MSISVLQDTRSLKTLKTEALKACKARGHKMGVFVLTHFYYKGKERASAVCSVCGKEVQVNTNPLPNEIDIGGEAVALNCRN